ncbi:MAG: Release factor glutamine methyltransferase [Candidatus Omnitrophica bacterium ADurb.Bin205]|nr:MAG: Release factor glutamine methyltransferase [Candidatus Omnitrophica bacterium ADurb.Bin205]
MTESELLFTHALGCKRESLYLDKGRRLTLSQGSFISSALKRRLSGEPLQYILGSTEFMGLEFKVNTHVLIPRFETEILVDAAIKYARSLMPFNRRVLEIGTGSGCIAISLAKFLPGLKITATDISIEALRVALDNARLNGVLNRVSFAASDLFDSLAADLFRYSICITNPPYVRSGEIDGLQPEVRHEPRESLDGGMDGLSFYRRIIKGSSDYLINEGILIMEIGFNQREGVEGILRDSNSFKVIEIIKDFNNIDRVIVARRG